MQALHFKPVLKTMLWGGEEIARLKALSAYEANIGESWEISAVPGSETPVSEGAYAGQFLKDLISQWGADLIGRHNYERYGTKFPLLIKFISSAKDLSVQVHPNDAIAQRMGHPFGKDEMWYVVRAEENAKLWLGFKDKFSPTLYKQSLANGSLMQHVNYFSPCAGNVFTVPAGTVHSIGAGNLLIEIQQTSDDTFRIYDYDRLDTNGQKRTLHVTQALEALNYEARADYQVLYNKEQNGISNLIASPHFTARLIDITSATSQELAPLDSFVIFIAFEGTARLQYAEGEFTLSAGNTILLPASTPAVRIIPLTGTFKAIETYC